MPKQFTEWLHDPIEQTSVQRAGAGPHTLEEKMIAAGVPVRKTLMRAAETRTTWADDPERHGEAVFGEGPADEYVLGNASLSIKTVEISPAQYQYTYPVVFLYMINDGAALPLLRWIVNKYTAVEFDAMFRLLGQQGFVKHMIALQAVSK